MNEDEFIKKLAEPIIQELEELEKKYSTQLVQLPQIKLVIEPGMKDLVIDDVQITPEIIEKLEAYIQEEIEMMHSPSILH